MVATDHQAVEVFHRTLEGWSAYHAHLYGPGDTVEIVSLGIQFPFAMLYRRTTVKESLDNYDNLQANINNFSSKALVDYI
ncbi:MAG: hypothetical protein NVSMB54_07480 [Ktedonobacteraceae bacterium]